MKHSSALLICCLLTTPLLAQYPTNYIATTPLSTTPGQYNVLVGQAAGNATMTGYSNILIGSYTGAHLTSGNQNTFVGGGSQNTSGDQNTFLGSATGSYNTNGKQNTFVGYESGYGNQTGSNNSFLGNAAGMSNTGGLQNVAVGSYAGYRNGTGSGNVAVGSASSFTNVSGSYNVMVGDSAGLNNTVSGNTFVGSKAGYTNKTGTNNSFLGYHAGSYVTTGSNNIIIGPHSGTAITDGSDNVLMGYNSQAEDGISNGIAIGSGTRVASSNSLILGNGVKVGIGTSAPGSKLEVVADEADLSGLRLSKLTSQSKTAQVTDQFLTTNERGDVIKARYQLRISDASEWSDKVFTPSYTLRPLGEVSSYIRQHGHLPEVPSAEQVAKEGIDLVKMNATLLEKVEELTLYSIQLDRTNHQLLQENKQQQVAIDELKRLMKLVLQKQ